MGGSEWGGGVWAQSSPNKNSHLMETHRQKVRFQLHFGQEQRVEMKTKAQASSCSLSVVITVAASVVIILYFTAFYQLHYTGSKKISDVDKFLENVWHDGAIDAKPAQHNHVEDPWGHKDIKEADLVGLSPLVIDPKGRVAHWEHGTIRYPAIESYDEHHYPKYNPLLSRIEEWNPDNPDVPADFTETLMHFNFSNPQERNMAMAYRNAEVPFKVYDVPFVSAVMEKWTDDYLSRALREGGKASRHVEKSESNHFMYWALKPWKKQRNQSYKSPTEIVTAEMDFDQWLPYAQKADHDKTRPVANKEDKQHDPYYYLMTNALKGDHAATFVARDIPVFSEGRKNFFIPKPDLNKGIQCRFGMRGIIAEAHYDSGRNMIGMFKGNKRYILNPPRACKQIDLISDADHPSFRHSRLDWSNVTVAQEHDFAHVDAIDTILRTGEVLFVPSYWMHYIISLQYSVQCNSRFGPPESADTFEPIRKCFQWEDSRPPKKSKAERRDRNV